jgi:hypothetical protein
LYRGNGDGERFEFSQAAMKTWRGNLCCVAFFLGVALCPAARGQNPSLRADAVAILDRIYSFDLDGAAADARNLQAQQPEEPLGYLLEAEAVWWKIWCTTAEYKYGMTYARRHAKSEADQHYLELAAKVITLADAKIKQKETAELHLYAGLGEAFSARLYGLRWENRTSARAGIRGREHFVRAIALDAQLADAYLGLGLYSYYVDTLSGIARVLRFFMGIPGGTKQEGVRDLQRAIAEGFLTPAEARFYLAINLENYDLQYEKALGVIRPLAEKYPSNPLFQLVEGDLYAKLGRKSQAVACYRAAGAVAVGDRECRAHVQGLVRAALAAQGQQ